MHIRLHLVRFMYINLILSCCFWLYDNVAAADAVPKSGEGGGGADADAAAAAAAAKASAQHRLQPEAPPKPATVTPEPPPDRTVKKVAATADTHPEAADREPLVESDYGNGPRTSEKPTKEKGVAATTSGRRDTSVHGGNVLEAAAEAPAPSHSLEPPNEKQQQQRPKQKEQAKER
ncbi:uncharacterized protein LOC121404413 [Drosophila obscura]|uniref:uncharacterized protein LOC121404413 n=1 Tax=Drosophila obscura TaxID=7282 RepID=UPI001BB2B0AF|nr:uncharacterized protein LOC121404413 [Drosophila obscura]